MELAWIVFNGGLWTNDLHPWGPITWELVDFLGSACYWVLL
jgi:hypothetical protein